MKQHRDLKFGNHTSIASDYIKYPTHNSSYEAVELFQGKMKKMEEEIRGLKSKNISLLKTSNVAQQKVDEAKKGIEDLTKTATKLENNKWLDISRCVEANIQEKRTNHNVSEEYYASNLVLLVNG